MTAFMEMPEAPVNKNDFTPRDEDDVWFSRKILAMESVAIAQRVGYLSDAHFRSSVLATHGPHTGGPLLRCEIISHQAASRRSALGRRPLHS